MKVIYENATKVHRRLLQMSGLIWLAISCILIVAVPAITSNEYRPVTLPIITATIGIAFFFWVLAVRKGGSLPYFEIGTVYATVVLLYTLLPLIGFILNGLAYTPFNDARLYNADPTSQQIGKVGWYFVVHLLAFIFAYLIIRGRLPRNQALFQNPDRIVIWAAVILFLLIKGFILITGWYFDLSTSTYSEEYLVSNRLPLLLAQLLNHLNGIEFTMALFILAALFGKYRKYRSIIICWLAIVGLTTFYRLGSRTEFILLLFSVAMMYHLLVRPIPFLLAILAGLGGLFIFILLGLMRSGWQLTYLLLHFNPFSHANEFESLFANAFDLSQLKDEGAIGHLPLSFFLTDIIRLVPQQLLPFLKIAPSVWYVNTFYPVYAASGGGLAFGTISESIVGGGWVDLIMRGTALGFILGLIHRFYVTRRPSTWAFTFYAWATIQAYLLFRGTTFYLLVMFLFNFLPAWLGVNALSEILKGIIRNDQQPIPGNV